jgi:hypothetical protein
MWWNSVITPLFILEEKIERTICDAEKKCDYYELVEQVLFGHEYK